MANMQFIEDLSIKFRELINASPAGDLETNFRALIEGAFTKLELVSREEFDIQADVLRRTRAKLNKLEARLEQLEAPLLKEQE